MFFFTWLIINEFTLLYRIPCFNTGDPSPDVEPELRDPVLQSKGHKVSVAQAVLSVVEDETVRLRSKGNLKKESREFKVWCIIFCSG